MKVSEIMASAVQMLDPGENVMKAARVMKEFNIGCVLVGSEGHVAGIVTDRDIVLRGVAMEEDISEMTLAEIMTWDPMFCSVDDTIRQAARIMQDYQIRRLPVLAANRTVVGIVSLGDICSHVPANLAGELFDSLSGRTDHPSNETSNWLRHPI
jgi:CBS domain-containing protein